MAEGMQGKVALITGAASGIGLATTEALIAAGARVVLADRDEKALGALRSRLGEAAVPLVVDLLDLESCAAMVPGALEKAGRIDILHCNAGTYIGGDLIETDT
ncbi:MAG TPA: SDR family NAD(P)-dependent oxidoreductase, partial [Amaricoccus sp.]|nr:SDR family NAD(P)-dependent oxidoreductase [Amaricoccus sp.]